jgi:acyl-CoA reductase-like NAD-dependent aldehyde dehydrogenase
VLGSRAGKTRVAHGSLWGDDEAQVSTHSVQVVAEAVVSATHAQPHWAARPLEQRQAVLLEFNRLLNKVCVGGGPSRGGGA